MSVEARFLARYERRFQQGEPGPLHDPEELLPLAAGVWGHCSCSSNPRPALATTQVARRGFPVAMFALCPGESAHRCPTWRYPDAREAAT